MNEEKVKTAELYAASENEKKSLIDWYKDHSHFELHDDGMNTLCKVCPPEEYGEDEDCEALQNIIRVMFYRITSLESELEQLKAENSKMREALGISESWPLTDVLLKLVESTEYLLDVKNYDRTGWEEVSYCTKLGRKYIGEINSVLAEQALKGK